MILLPFFFAEALEEKGRGQKKKEKKLISWIFPFPDFASFKRRILNVYRRGFLICCENKRMRIFLESSEMESEERPGPDKRLYCLPLSLFLPSFFLFNVTALLYTLVNLLLLSFHARVMSSFFLIVSSLFIFLNNNHY